MVGVLGPALGEEIVTEARRREGFPQEGQNLRELSLQSLWGI